VLDSLRSESSELLLLDAGGFTGHQSATAEARGLFNREMMKQMGYAAGSLTAEDLRLGPELVGALAQEMEMPLVSANLVDLNTGRLVLRPYTVVERAGLRIAVTAVAQHDDVLDGQVTESGFAFLDPLERLPAILDDMRRDADFSVLLAHLPLDEAQRIGEAMPDQIDLVVIGGQKNGRGGPRYREHGGAVYVVAGNRGQALGVTRLAIERGRVTAAVGEELVLSREYPENETVAAAVTEFQGNLNELMKEHAVSRARDRAAPDGHYYLNAQNCAACHQREYEIWLETPHSDAFRSLVAVGQEALPECYACHVTGHGDPAGYFPHTEEAAQLVNVQCEVCHGKGTAHARDGSYGASLKMNSCVTCHDPDNSPDFDPEVYWLMMEH
jgi:hypothetical protein